jgi:hypothetical protein
MKGYNPLSWEYTLLENGEKIYSEHRLNIVQQNLKTIYDLIDDIRINANNDLLVVQNNLNTKSVHNPTAENTGWLASKLIEGLGVIFPSGTALAIMATIIAKLTSAGITAVSKDASKDLYNPIQQAVNDTRDCMNAILNELELKITKWNKNMKEEWNTEYECSGVLIPELKGKITLSELGNFDMYFPKKGESDDYVNTRIQLSKHAISLLTQHLLPVKWKIRKFGAHPDGDSQGGYNAYWFWSVSWYETSSTDKWNEWKRYNKFPEIPSNLKDNVSGPFEDIGFHQNINGYNQYYQPFAMGGNQNTSGPYTAYWWTRMSNKRWMYWGGRYCTNMDAKTQGDNCQSETRDGNIVKGTPFTDFIEDILYSNKYTTMYNDKSTLVWYKLKDSNGNEYINSRKIEHLTCTNYCNDWYYQKNLFKWNWAFKGIQLRFYSLVDINGNTAPDVLINWLFKDDGHGKTLNPNGIASRVDVYHKWNLSFYN